MRLFRANRVQGPVRWVMQERWLWGRDHLPRHRPGGYLDGESAPRRKVSAALDQRHPFQRVATPEG